MGPGTVKPESGKPGINLFPGAQNVKTENLQAKIASAVPGVKVFPKQITAMQMISAMGLRQDSFNRALLIFTRFFSLPSPFLSGLPVKTADFLAELRRVIQNLQTDKNINENSAKTENTALLAAALAGKDVKISPAVFDQYLQSFDPTDFDQSEENQSEENQHNGRQNESGGKNPGQHNPDNKEESKKITAFLNSVPDKNGQRWIVWPFKTLLGGVKLNVVVKFLVKPPFPSANGCIIADISTPSKKWQVILYKSEGNKTKININVFPEQNPSVFNKLKKEAAELFDNTGKTEISVSSGKNSPSCADILEKILFNSVNEVV